jgi:hypothetical protein
VAENPRDASGVVTIPASAVRQAAVTGRCDRPCRRRGADLAAFRQPVERRRRNHGQEHHMVRNPSGNLVVVTQDGRVRDDAE